MLLDDEEAYMLAAELSAARAASFAPEKIAAAFLDSILVAP
jgi:hypothetical protein